MKYTFFFSLLLVVSLVQAQQDKINKGETWHRIYLNQRLELTTDEGRFSAEIKKGHDLTFEYYMRADERANMTDDEYMEKIIFSVPRRAKSFNYTDTTLHAAFLRGC